MHILLFYLIQFIFWVSHIIHGSSWSWLYGSWIYNYLWNQCLSPLTLWALILIRARCTTLCDKVCQWLATGRWFSLGPPVSYTNKNDCHDITEILLKVALKYYKQIKPYYTMNSAIFFIYFVAVCVHLELLETRDITLKCICNSQLTVPLWNVCLFEGG